MAEELQKAYTAYQQALFNLPNPKEPRLWYGIGILYDRYGSEEHAEEAFTAVLKMDAGFEKANEVYYRLGGIYRSQRRYDTALECYEYILERPPAGMTRADILFHIGFCHELKKDVRWKEAEARNVTRCDLVCDCKGRVREGSQGECKARKGIAATWMDSASGGQGEQQCRGDGSGDQILAVVP